jgi:hypothetical protein
MWLRPGDAELEFDSQFEKSAWRVIMVLRYRFCLYPLQLILPVQDSLLFGRRIPLAEFTQGASDYRFARVYRDGREIGFASWMLQDGKWELSRSLWDESRKPTRRDGRKAETPSP